MNHTSNNLRLLAEVLGIAAVAQAATMLCLPLVAAGVGAELQWLIGAGLLVCFAAPAVYWRCMAAPRRVTDRPAGAKRNTGIKSAIALTAATQFVGLFLTAGCVYWQVRSNDATAKAKFERSAERIEVEIKRRFAQPLDGLMGARGAYAANPKIGRGGFKDYVASRNLELEFPGVRGFGYIERVLRADLDRFVSAERSDSAPEFAVRTSGEASDLYVSRFVEPLERNKSSWGFDMGQEPVRREALERAVTTGQAALSGRIVLDPDGKQDPGFLYLLPIYARDAQPITPQQHKASLLGVLYASVDVTEIMSNVAEVADGTLDFELFEGDGTHSKNLIFDADAHVTDTTGAMTKAQFVGRTFESSRTFMVGGQMMVMRVSTQPGFDATIDRSGVAVVGLGGALGSCLMAMAVWLFASGRVRAQNFAQRMTADLDRLARVAQHTSNAVVITDAQRRITWLNEGFTRMTGYSSAEAVGRTLGDLLSTGKSDTFAMKTLANAELTGEACRVELLNRTKDGREFWMDAEIQPTRDEHGLLTGFVRVATDITQQKLTQAKLESALRETDSLLRTIHQHAVVSVADSSGTIIEVNDTFCQISGYQRSELLGQNHRIIGSGVHPAKFWEDMWRTIAGGSSWQGEICNRAKDGSLYWVDSMIAPITGADGQIEKYLSIRSDITASKASQLRMSEMADRLTLAIEGGSDGVWDWMDVNTDAQWWSPNAYAMLGYSPNEMPPSSRNLISVIHPDFLRAASDAVRDALAGRAPFDVEYQLRTKSGAYRWYRARAKVYFGPSGRAQRMAGSLQDVHDRKLAEQELARERRRLGHILEGTNVATWEWNVESGETRFSDRWAQMLGYTLAEIGQTTVDTCAQFTHPEDFARSTSLLEQHFNGELRYYECELRMQHKDGHWIWLLDRGKLVSRTDSGAPLWMAGTYMDITRRKQAEGALRASEAFLDRAGRIAGVGGWQLELDSDRFIWSEQMCAIHDVPNGLAPSVEEALNFYPPAARLAIEFAMQEAREHGTPWDIEVPLVTSAGRNKWVRVVGEAEFEGAAPVRLVGACQDVTERRALDEQLRRSNDLMSGVLSHLPFGLGVFDSNLHLVAHNIQAAELLDLPSDLITTPDVTYEDFVRFNAQRGEHGSIDVEAYVSKEVDRVRQPVNRVYERVRVNGRPLEIREGPMPGGGFITTFADIQERKRAELQLKEALSRAEQASVAKSQFLANMSHEIRTPMNAILGMLKLLQNTPLSLRQIDYVAKTDGAARSLLGLLNDILDFSKVEAGKMTLDERPFSTHRFLTDLSVILSANVGTKPVQLKFDVDPIVPNGLVGDDMRLRQVLINLGSNAIKFTEAGLVVMRVRVVEKEEHEVLLEFSVSDSGIGIAPENQERIFSGFSQAEASTTRRFGGTGLGLAISQRLVDLMGGKLRLDSALGEGSTFHFRLRMPVVELLADHTAGHATQPSPLFRPELGALRVLIVDSQVGSREALANMARGLGWKPEEASSREEALAQVQARLDTALPYDVVLIDGQGSADQAWETGNQILRLVDDADETAVLQLVSQTERGELAVRAAATQEVSGGVLIKPFTPATLLNAVADARMPATARTQQLLATPDERPRRLEGIRLLVVEDNANNQQVAKELLADEGADVALADNGEAGVAAVAAANPPFDVVLMDLQMPVMDGFTAAAQIRFLLGKSTLPIIAMTANAMEADRQACLAAGMNDHVGKPFDLNDLVNTLLRHTGRVARPVRQVARAAPGVAADVLADAQSRDIDLAAALNRLGGNSGVYLRALQSFLASLSSLPDQLAGQLAQANLHDATCLMHTVKGMAATLGILPMARLAAQAEKRLAAGADEGLHLALIDELRAAVEASQRDLTHLSQRLSEGKGAVASGTSTSPDTVRLRDSLSELAQLLRQCDMRALEVFEQLQQEHAEHLKGALLPLDEAIAVLNFEQALTRCEALAQEVVK